MRESILDAYDYTCQYCFNDTANRVDHIIPMNPENSDLEKIANMSVWLPEDTLDCIDNFTAACHPCNARKSNKIISESKIVLLQEEAKKRKEFIITSLNGLIPRSKPATEYLSSEQIKQLLLTKSLQNTIKEDPRSFSMNLFDFSIIKWLEEKVEDLIYQGADIYALGQVGLFWAVNYRKMHIIDGFVTRKINMESYSDVFSLAVYRGYPEIAEMFSEFSKNKSRLNKLYDVTIERNEKCPNDFNGDYLRILEILSKKGAKPASERTAKEDLRAYLENNLDEMLSIIADPNTQSRFYKVNLFSKKYPDRLALCFSTLLRKENLSQEDICIAHTLLNKGADISFISDEDISRLIDESIKIVSDNKFPDRRHLLGLMKHTDTVYLSICLSLLFEQDNFLPKDMPIVKRLLEKGAEIFPDSYNAINRIIGRIDDDFPNTYVFGDLVDIGWDAYEKEEWFTGFDLPDIKVAAESIPS